LFEQFAFSQTPPPPDIKMACKICCVFDNSVMHCPILLKFVHVGALPAPLELVIKAEKNWQDGRPQLAMHR